MADTTVKTHFLTLPQEVRDSIYEFVYTDTAIQTKQTESGYTFTSTYKCLPPRLSAVCKQLRAEAEDRVFKQKFGELALPALRKRYFLPAWSYSRPRFGLNSSYWRIMVETPRSPTYSQVLIRAQVDVEELFSALSWQQLRTRMRHFRMTGVGRTKECARPIIFSTAMSPEEQAAIMSRVELCELLAEVSAQLHDSYYSEQRECSRHVMDLRNAVESLLEDVCGKRLRAIELLGRFALTPRAKLS
ncbi:hypothetical protein CERZMDRAFT_100351 [Cercospora zeae-maydis SCOH1-5]|uniref:2EXR domain-containing protein n=1 Tax=Cercospora zeae-maydis SCOH1-5 TaxID=717836 RepID=A0A6A6F6P9_9PEZI|nr:hypothetical protein CERZMDRAFT_100351 [Cercospora zeae-maydis SCOH1-5]